MKRSFNLLALGALVAVLFVLTQILFIVRQGEVAVLTRLGRPVGAISEPGLYRRWPLPVRAFYGRSEEVRRDPDRPEQRCGREFLALDAR